MIINEHPIGPLNSPEAVKLFNKWKALKDNDIDDQGLRDKLSDLGYHVKEQNGKYYLRRS